jgi:hypothetical protein
MFKILLALSLFVSTFGVQLLNNGDQEIHYEFQTINTTEVLQFTLI